MQPNITDALDLTFNETLGLNDTQALNPMINIIDAILLVDALTKSISDKRLNETIRLQDWLSIKKKPAANIWGD
jgi:hypothetical protein